VVARADGGVALYYRIGAENRVRADLNVGTDDYARSDFDREDAKLVRLLSLSAKTIAFARINVEFAR